MIIFWISRNRISCYGSFPFWCGSIRLVSKFKDILDSLQWISLKPWGICHIRISISRFYVPPPKYKAPHELHAKIAQDYSTTFLRIERLFCTWNHGRTNCGARLLCFPKLTDLDDTHDNFESLATYLLLRQLFVLMWLNLPRFKF